MTRHIRRQLIGYIISGLLATGADYIVYNILVYVGLYYSIAKTISFLTGTIIAFFYNKHITFKVPERSYREVAKFFTLYIISMLCNVTGNSVGIKMFIHVLPYHISLTLAFLCATFISMIINFFGQKFWVFRK